MEREVMNSNEPLAFRMRPKTLDDYVGQEHVLGKDKILYRTIKADRLSSIIPVSYTHLPIINSIKRNKEENECLKGK